SLAGLQDGGDPFRQYALVVLNPDRPEAIWQEQTWMILIYESVFADQLRRVHPAEQDQACFDRALETAFLSRPDRLGLKWSKESAAYRAGLQNPKFSRRRRPVVGVHTAAGRNRGNEACQGIWSFGSPNL